MNFNYYCSNIVGCKGKIKPTAPKESQIMFGGKLTRNQYMQNATITCQFIVFDNGYEQINENYTVKGIFMIPLKGEEIYHGHKDMGYTNDRSYFQ